MLKKFPFLLAAGVVLSFSPVAFAQPVFGPAVNMGPKINTASYEMDPFLTANGKKLFFSDGADIWFSEMTDTGWTNAKKLGPQINYNIFFQRSPSVSPDGQKLYYVDAERDGYNWDIWVSIWDSSIGDWSTPQNLDVPVNTPGDEFSARIAPDGRHLYFTSQYVNLRYGLYVSEWNGTNWTQPVYLGDNANQCSPEYPSVTADRNWLYFHCFVDDGISTLVSEWTDSSWGPPIDLRPQLGGNTGWPFIVASGDSLIFSGWETEFSGYGGWDLFVAQRISTSIDDSGAIPLLPKAFELYQNYPNPFNARTKIRFFVSKTVNDRADITVFNLLGLPVRHLIRTEVIRDQREIEWDGTDDEGKGVSTGIYFIRLKVGNEFAVKRAIFVK